MNTRRVEDATERVIPSHTALCVSDIEQSTRFYVEGLGYEARQAYETGGDEIRGLCEVAGEGPVSMQVQFLSLGATKLELIGWSAPGTVGSPAPARNQLGLTHLSYEVTDLEAVVADLVELGATVIESGRMSAERPTYTVKMVFLADPDGTRIELVEHVAR
jgi:catechol 2,3-dioxygenase-like lactoylglutathione lyase family enzyme